MKSLIMIILLSIGVGFIFLHAYEGYPANFFIFGFAAFGLLFTLRALIAWLIKIIKKNENAEK